MATREVARDFDQISPEYDATRDPLDAETIARLAELLRADGVRSVLEVGVGTGRIAGPLGTAGFELTGVDASRGMLREARRKGLANLVRGTAYHLPFPSRGFDAALFVHVLHLLDDPRAALREAIRVGAHGAYALVHPAPPGHDDLAETPLARSRSTVYRILAAKGYEVPTTGGGPPVRERKLLRELPPDRMDILTDREITEPVGRTLRLLQRGASRPTLKIPKDVLQEAVRQAELELGDQTVTYRRREALALWSRAPGADPSG